MENHQQNDSNPGNLIKPREHQTLKLSARTFQEQEMRAHTISPPTAACSAARAPSLESDWQQFLQEKEYPRRFLALASLASPPA
jgi:hypothetical protein